MIAYARAGDLRKAKELLAPIRADWDVIENGSYHSLLLLYKGERRLEDLIDTGAADASGTAVRYGVSAWLVLEGRADEARTMWEAIVEQPDWPSFGHVAAEAELARN